MRKRAQASILIGRVEPLKPSYRNRPAGERRRRRALQTFHSADRHWRTAHRPQVSRRIEMGVIDILQTDINHVGGITALWKVGQMAAYRRR
jgi:galactonate dehydratase